MLRVILYLIGFWLLCFGTVHSAVFLNLIPSGYTEEEYVTYMFSHTETYFIPVGLLLIHLSTIKRKSLE